jgi:hypothetical protein
MKVIKTEENASLVELKDWAEKRLPPDNELREAILNEECDIIPRWEANVKMEAYSRVLDAKYKLMTNE